MAQWPLLVPTDRRLPLEKLKVCPLCNSLNAKQNVECFVCCWSGDFCVDDERIANALYEVILDCPAIIDLITLDPPKRRTLAQRLLSALRLRRKPFDFRA